MRDAIGQSPFPDPDNRLLHTDVQTFLVNNLLEYTDKMSMSVALEVRVPLLDPRFVEFSLNVPFHHKLQARRSAVLHKAAFNDFFPPDVRDGRKRGFNVPLAHWMISEFDTYFEASQEPGHPLRQTLGRDVGITWREGMLDWGVIQKLRNQHRQCRRETHTSCLPSSCLMFGGRSILPAAFPEEAPQQLAFGSSQNILKVSQTYYPHDKEAGIPPK